MKNNCLTYVITGAANGIGQATKELLLSYGIRTIICDREKIVSDDYIYLNLADNHSIDECTKSIPNGIDGVINCAGVAPGDHPHNLVLTVNWLGTRFFTEKLLNKIKTKGCVTTVASRAGADWERNMAIIEPFLNCSFDNLADKMNMVKLSAAKTYELSKELLIVWSMKNAATQESIRFNTVSPSSVATRLTPAFKEAFKEITSDNSKLRSNSTTSGEIAQAIWFLSDPQNPSINGIDLKVDQGITAKRKNAELVEI